MTPNDILLYIALGLSAIALSFSYFHHRRLGKIFRSRKSDLEEVIEDVLRRGENCERAIMELQRSASILHRKNAKSVRGLSLVRFNPFKDQGGNHSFAAALLDEEGNGVVLSSLYARERMSIFGKSIEKGRCPTPLTDEEKQAVNEAMEKMK